MALFWHWVSLAFVVVGSLLIVLGFVRTDLLHGGIMSAVVGLLRRIRDKVLRRPPRLVYVTGELGAMGTLEGFGSAVLGPLDASLSDAENIAKLYEIVHSMQVNESAALVSQNAQRRQDRADVKAANDRLEDNIVELRAELWASIKSQALEGLGTALAGAILLGVGDIIGTIIPLFE